jgi:hypothetical protein
MTAGSWSDQARRPAFEVSPQRLFFLAPNHLATMGLFSASPIKPVANSRARHSIAREIKSNWARAEGSMASFPLSLRLRGKTRRQSNFEAAGRQESIPIISREIKNA